MADVFEEEDRPLLLGAQGDTTENLLWRIQNGEGLDKRQPPFHTAYVLAGGSDWTWYFPSRLLRYWGQPPTVTLAAQRIANATASIAAALKAQSCKTHVVLVGLLPQAKSLQEPKIFAAAEVSNGLVQKWAEASSGVSFLDCFERFESEEGIVMISPQLVARPRQGP